MLYELLTGLCPFKRDRDSAILAAAVACEIAAPSMVADVPSEVDGVVTAALAKAPGHRHQNAQDFQLALEELLRSRQMLASSVQVSAVMKTLVADGLASEAVEKPARPEHRRPPAVFLAG